MKCTHVIQSCHDVGDIFSIAYAEQSQLLFFGCQNTSIQWYDFDEHAMNDKEDIQTECQKTRFFKLFHEMGLDGKQHHDEGFQEEEDLVQCVVTTNHVFSNAHDGYVYCMAYANIPNIENDVLITGSGDGNIHIWSIEHKMIQLHQTLTGSDPDRSILSLAVSSDGYLFCGVQGGHVQV